MLLLFFFCCWKRWKLCSKTHTYSISVRAARNCILVKLIQIVAKHRSFHECTLQMIQSRWNEMDGGVGWLGGFGGDCVVEFGRKRKPIERLNLENLHSSGRTINHCQHGHCSPPFAQNLCVSVCVCVYRFTKPLAASNIYIRACRRCSSSWACVTWCCHKTESTASGIPPFNYCSTYTHSVYSIFKLDYSMHARLPLLINAHKKL